MKLTYCTDKKNIIGEYLIENKTFEICDAKF